MKKTSNLLAFAIASIMSTAYAAPDAGQTLQQLQQKSLTLPKTDNTLITAPMSVEKIEKGGQLIEIKTILISGNKVFNAEHIRKEVLNSDELVGRAHDLSTITSFADKISTYYREYGYPFARAFIPAQTIDNGVLRIHVVEGVYGKVQAFGSDDALNKQAQSFLSSLKLGNIIENSALERSLMILSDQAGIKTSPIVQPGSATGEGDLIVDIKRDQPYSGGVGFDNHGNRYTGEHRLKSSLNFNSPFMLGDQIKINGLYSEEHLWFGGLGYNLPLNTDGLRANLNYAHTYYQLGKDFKDLGAKGTADIFSAGLNYQIIRSQKINLNLSASLQSKTIHDDPSKTANSNTKHSNSIPITLNFDTRDSMGGGGITFGELTWTKGNLELNDSLTATDTNNTAGAFDKLNLDLARIQSITQDFSLFVRGSAQWSNKNLDSSEGFGIGGITGVRAYPTGEGYANVGWLTQTELRYRLNSHFSPYAFYDSGSSTANQTSVNGNTTRNISGAGLGLRYSKDNWNVDVSGAWSLNGGKPDDKNVSDASPRLWTSLNYQF